MKRLLFVVWVAAAAAAAAGAEKALPDGREVPPPWAPVPGVEAEEGKAAFPGFDSGREEASPVEIGRAEGRMDPPETPVPAAARFLSLYRAFLLAPSERTLLDLLVDAVDAGSHDPPPPEIRAFLLEQLSQDPPPVYRVDLGDAPEIDAWTVAHACAESLFSGIPSPSGPGSVVAICSRRRGEDIYRFHLCRIPPSLLPALREAVAGPAF